jgi:hypothetical protein
MGCEPTGPLTGTTAYTAATITTTTSPETLCSSPNVALPTLTFSPSSTESSSGDRTIQMATFIKPTGSFSIAAPFDPGKVCLISQNLLQQADQVFVAYV